MAAKNYGNPEALREVPEPVLERGEKGCSCEVWKEVPGWKAYEVSDKGNVRRKRKHYIAANGYPVVALCRPGESQVFYVHDLVARLFIGDRPLGLFINHKDGVKGNPDWANLEYVTRRQNVEHAVRTGLYRKGGKAPAAKLTDGQAREVRRLADEAVIPQRQIAKMFGIKQGTVVDIKRRRTWKYLGEKP